MELSNLRAKPPQTWFNVQRLRGYTTGRGKMWTSCGAPVWYQQAIKREKELKRNAPWWLLCLLAAVLLLSDAGAVDCGLEYCFWCLFFGIDYFGLLLPL